MRKGVNIAVVIFVYAAGWFVARLLVGGQYAQVAPEIAKWLWSVGALLIGILGQLSWKIHEAKRAEGLSVQQRARLRRTTSLVSLRLLLIGLVIFLSSVGGFVAPYITNTVVAAQVTQGTLGAMLASALLCLALVPLIQRDIQRFEDRAREALIRKKAQDELSEKLK